MAPQGAQRRKTGKKAQPTGSTVSQAAGGDSQPAAQTKIARKAGPKPAAATDRPTEAPLALQAAAALAALLLLLFAHHAAVRLLAPQTGEWLAGSFCSLALFAVSFAAVALGHAVVAASTLLAARDSAASPSGIIPTAWWLAAGSALIIALLRPEQVAGSLLLSPGLADSSGRRITDAQLTLGAMATAVFAFGPLFGTLGCAAGACTSRALRRLGPSSRPLLAVLPLVAGTAAAGLAVGLPAAVLPPRPGSTLLPALAAAAAIMSAALAPRQAGRSGSRAVATATGLVAVAAALLVGSLRQPCAAINRPLQGGRYTVLWRCEMAAGGQLSVVEGTLRDQYRYRLLRLDHSIMGGEYVAPPEVAGQSVYSAFYLQQAAALLRPNGTRSLHVGLGIGTAVKAMQRLGVAADALELHPEVLHAAQRYFGLQPALHGGRALVGDAAQLVPRLGAEGGPRYDYILHDVFSGGGIAPLLMERPFFRQLHSALAPGGVLAVNYFGGRGAGLKQAWCRLRLEFGSVRAFSDIEQSRLRNHVLFASDIDLTAVNLTAGLAAVEARAAAIQAAAAAGDSTSSSGQQAGQALEEVLDPLQLQVWRALPRQEVHLTYDRQRCEQLLELHGAPAGRSSSGSGSSGGRSDGGGSSGSSGSGGRSDGGGSSGSSGSGRSDGGGSSGGSGSSADASEAAAQQRRSAFEQRAAGKATKKGPLGKLGQAQRQRQQAQQAQQAPWVWRKMKEVRERHAVAVGHWVAMRTGWSDAFWLD